MSNPTERWIVIREGWPAKTGKPIALMMCRYDVQAGVWYNVQSEGTYSAEDFSSLEEWTGPVPKEGL